MSIEMRQIKKIGLPAVLTLSFLLAFQNCGVPMESEDTEPVTKSRKVTQADLDYRYDSIRTIAGSDLACESDSDCVVYAVGSKQCGGAAEYVVTSNDNDPALLSRMSSELRDLESRFNRENDELISDCRIVEPPLVGCRAKLCATL